MLVKREPRLISVTVKGNRKVSEDIIIYKYKNNNNESFSMYRVVKRGRYEEPTKAGSKQVCKEFGKPPNIYSDIKNPFFKTATLHIR